MFGFHFSRIRDLNWQQSRKINNNDSIVNMCLWYLSFIIYFPHVNGAWKKKKRWVLLPSKLLLNVISDHIQSYDSFQSN